MLCATSVLRPEGGEPSLSPPTPRGGLWHGGCGAELPAGSAVVEQLAEGAGTWGHTSVSLPPQSSQPLERPIVWLFLGEQGEVER